MTRMIVLAALCASAAHAGSAGEAELSARLETRVEEALARMLGPGRAAATVRVRGERVTKREESMITGATGPSGRPAPVDTAILQLPGYAKGGASGRSAPAVATVLHTASEETLREGSFAVTGVSAWLVLDERLDEGAVEEAARVAADILALDRARGDELKVLRTPFLPAWRAAFSRPRDLRALALLILGAFALLLCAAVLGRALARASRVPAPSPAPAVAAPPSRSIPGPARRIVPLPPLDKGGRAS